MKPFRILNRKGSMRDEGAAFFEFALILPLILALAGGIIDLGLLLLTLHNAQGAASDGVRIAAMMEAVDFTTDTDKDGEYDVLEKVKDAVLFRNYDKTYSSKIVKVSIAKNSASIYTGCDEIITVSVEAYHNFYFLNLVGLADRVVKKTAHMRWLNQDLCGA